MSKYNPIRGSFNMAPVQNFFAEGISQEVLKRQFSVNTSCSIVELEVQGLQADNLINYWSTFEPTINAVFPGAASNRHAVDDIAAVLSGSKPAALFELSFFDGGDSLFIDLIDKVVERDDLNIKGGTGFGGSELVYMGLPEPVETLSYQYMNVRSGFVGADFHIAVGSALGYPMYAIESFLRRT